MTSKRLLTKLDGSGYTDYLAVEYQHEEWLNCNRVDCISETAALRDLLLASGDGWPVIKLVRVDRCRSMC